MSYCSGFSGYSGFSSFSGITGACSTPCVMDVLSTNLQPLVDAGYLSHVFEGKYRSPETEDLDSALRQGPAEIIGYFAYRVRERVALGQTSPGTLEIEGLLSVYSPSDTSSTQTCMLQLAEMVLAATNNEASFRDCSARPTRCVYRPVTDEVDDKIQQFEYELTFQVGPTPGSD